MIKFEHTVFALPFAYIGYLLGSRGEGEWSSVFWISVAMISARTSGMCLNRLIDLKIDAKNPRTQTRALVTGALSREVVLLVVILSFLLLIVSVLQLNVLCQKLLPVAIVFLFAYHYLKRFTVFCHFGIGLVLACAPIGGWIAATASWEWGMLSLGLAVLFWVAGFDVIYSLQDESFDRNAGLHSVPAVFGRSRALAIAAVCHLLTVGFMGGLGIMLKLSGIYWVGWLLAALLLTMEHYLVRQNKPKLVKTAFFDLNGILSITFFTTTWMAVSL